MSATHVAVILRTRTGPAYEEEFTKMDYPDVRNGGHHSLENEPRSRRNEREMEEKDPDYVPSAQCQI
ncbi:hypothetical protein SCLCIDRAFT_27522 [Scleroderma citrinum Foug A]|uniref:Uncharacterized protein n=1 Tax=Scleroderma citrinum Foug A TaxID=1036808 RepID=A0A0C3DSZ7_9AGAM|nr:hypothetical protein SCLCIDRAFT_27522 [Scleroderma citrinum Foug A]